MTDRGLSRLKFAQAALSSGHAFAQRIQLAFESLGGASGLLVLVGVGAGMFASYLSGLMIESSLRHAQTEMSNSLIGMKNP